MLTPLCIDVTKDGDLSDIYDYLYMTTGNLTFPTLMLSYTKISTNEFTSNDNRQANRHRYILN